MPSRRIIFVLLLALSCVDRSVWGAPIAAAPETAAPSGAPADAPTPVKQPGPESAPSAQPENPPPPSPSEAVPAEPAKPVLDTQAILGVLVHGRAGSTIGRIVDILVDQEGVPRDAIIDSGGFMGVGSRRFIVAWRDLRFDANNPDQPIKVLKTSDEIKALPDYKGTAHPTPTSPTAPSSAPVAPAGAEPPAEAPAPLPAPSLETPAGEPATDSKPTPAH